MSGQGLCLCYFFCKNVPHYNSLTLMGRWHLAASMIKTRPVTKGWMSSLWANGQHATLSLENLNAKPVPDILVVRASQAINH